MQNNQNNQQDELITKLTKWQHSISGLSHAIDMNLQSIKATIEDEYQVLPIQVDLVLDTISLLSNALAEVVNDLPQILKK